MYLSLIPPQHPDSFRESVSSSMEVIYTILSTLSMMGDASPEVLESMEDDPNVHEEEVLIG